MFDSINFIDAHKYLYHYTSREVLLEYILPSEKIKMSQFGLTNDPRESKKWSFTIVFPGIVYPLNSNEVNSIIDKANLLVKEYCKVICFTRDDPNIEKLHHGHKIYGRGYAHPRMWAQYAKRHTGVCIVFDKKIFVRP